MAKEKEIAKETPQAIDYSKYASMAETPEANHRRQFDYLSVSGEVRTEVIHTEKGDEVEKRIPAKAFKLLLTQPKEADGRYKSEEIDLPLTIVPIKYRMVMEQRAGSKGEILVLKSSEFNGKMSDKVVITRFSPEGKVVEKYGPMTVSEARQNFRNAEGKNVLKDKAHVYSLHNGELVRYAVKGTGLWEALDGLVEGKTELSRTPFPFLNEYFSTFPMTEPYFLYEMKVSSAYRDHGNVKYYRPIFERGARISTAVEAEVLAHLEDLHAYFVEMDKATAEFTPMTKSAPVAIVEDEEVLGGDGDIAF